MMAYLSSTGFYIYPLRWAAHLDLGELPEVGMYNFLWMEIMIYS